MTPLNNSGIITTMNKNSKAKREDINKANIGAKRKSNKPKVGAKVQTGESKGMSIIDQLKFLGHTPK